MGRSSRILRTSIFSFLQKYQYFTSAPSLLVFPYAASALLLQPVITSSPLLALAHARLTSLFLAAGFPPSSYLFAFLNLKLSQSILASFLVSPFTLSFLLLAKASVITALEPDDQPSVTSRILLFNALFVTQLCNTLIVLAANATCFFVVALLFNFLDVLGFYSPGPLLIVSAIVYSIILANAYIVCNLALVQSGMERHGGFISILKACIMIQGRNVTALTLAVFVNTALAAVEALFQYRIMRSYHHTAAPNSAILLEGMFIAYLYSLLLVLDTVVGCVFWRTCKKVDGINQKDTYYYQIEIQEPDGKYRAKTETLDILP